MDSRPLFHVFVSNFQHLVQESLILVQDCRQMSVHTYIQVKPTAPAMFPSLHKQSYYTHFVDLVGILTHIWRLFYAIFHVLLPQSHCPHTEL